MGDPKSQYSSTVLTQDNLDVLVKSNLDGWHVWYAHRDDDLSWRVILKKD